MGKSIFDIKVKSPYFDMGLFSQYDNQVTIQPLSTELDEEDNIEVLCLENNSRYSLTMKNRGSLATVTSLLQQSCRNNMCPIKLIRTIRRNGTSATGQQRFSIIYSHSYLIENTQAPSTVNANKPKMTINDWCNINKGDPEDMVQEFRTKILSKMSQDQSINAAKGVIQWMTANNLTPPDDLVSISQGNP